MSKGVFFKFECICDELLLFSYGDMNEKNVFKTYYEYTADFFDFRNRILEGKHALWNSCAPDQELSFIGKIIDAEYVEFSIVECISCEEYTFGDDDMTINIPATKEYIEYKEKMPVKQLVTMFDDFLKAYNKAIKI